MYQVFANAAEPLSQGVQIIGWAFLANIVLNKLWSPVFFALHMSYLSLAMIVAIEALNILIQYYMWVGGFTNSFWCFLPYTIWCAFAFVLNAEWCWYERSYVQDNNKKKEEPLMGVASNDVL
jgi:tryptophan-rich sensory protein